MRRFLPLTCAALVAAPTLASAAPARGVVVDDAGAPVAEAAVIIAGIEVTTDAAGAFAIDDVGAGTQDVLVVADGFEPLLGRAVPGRPLRLVLVRGGLVNDVELVTLEADAPFVDEPAPYDLDPATVGAVAGAGNDALKAVQSLPGVARIPFGLGGLVLRGQSPRNSSVFLDGVEVPLLYHFGGLASFIPTPMLDGLEVMPGTFGARFGRTQGGVVEVRSRAARTDRWRGATEVSLIDAQARAEGPVAGGGVMFGLRRSYVDGILAAAAPDLTLAPRYFDGQLRFDRGSASAPGGQLTALVFGSDDLLTFANPGDDMEEGSNLNYRSRFVRAAFTWRREEGPWRATVTPSIGADEVSLRFDEQGITRTNLPLALRAETERTWTNGRLAGGLDLVGTRYGFDITNEAPAMPGMPESGEITSRTGSLWAADLGAWVEGFYRFEDGRLGLRPGLRVDRYGLSDEWVVDPRLAVTHELPGGWTMATAFGRYHQPPSVVDLDPAFGNQALTASWSNQASFGVTAPLPSASSVAVTAYWEQSQGLAVDAVTSATAQAAGGPQGGGVGAASRELTDEQFGSYSYRENTGRGRGAGVEVMLRKRSGAWAGWLAYTYARAERRGDPRLDPTWRPYVLDQPHVLTAVAAVPLGAWQLGARLRFASGNPITPVAGAYFDVDRQDYRPIDGPILSERLPAFAQLDVRVDRTWRRPWGVTKLFLDIQNVSNRLNPEGVSYNFDYSQRSYTRGLPVFPSLGVEFTP